MGWQPDPRGLQEVLVMLRESASNDTAVQSAVTQRLHDLRQNSDFLAYLAHALLYCPDEEVRNRCAGGLALKNSLISRSDPVSLSDPGLAYVRGHILDGLSDKDPFVRATTATVVSALISLEEPGAWPEALDTLTKGMVSPDEKLAEACFDAIEKTCEDAPHKLDLPVQGQNLYDHLVPQFIKYTGHSVMKIRIHNLHILQCLAAMRVPAINANIDGYIHALFSRAADQSPIVRKAVCAALGLILTTRADKLVPEMKNVVDFMSYCTKDEDEQVVLEACEFMLTFAEDPNLKETLRLYLPQIAPLLLNKMVYSYFDLALLDVDEEDEAVPDRDEDIKPKTYSSKVHSHETNDPSSSTGGGGGKSREAADRALEEEDDENDDDYDPDDDDEDDDSADWNVRKCSAAALDVMAVSFGNDLLEILLPHLKERLFSTEWDMRESGILALGAIAEGCMSGLEPHLPQLLPWLLQSLKDEKALIRSITCWTLGRYASWAVQSHPEDKSFFFMPTMEGLLQMILDGNKRVQEAGCSAFATLEEEAGIELQPFLEPILRNLTYAFKKYQQKNLLILYDAIGTLADSVGSALGQPVYLDILMPPLIERWMKLGDDDPDLVPLLECLSSVSIAAGSAFAPYTPPVYQRCLTIIQTTLMAYQTWDSNPEVYEEPDRTFIVVALDLLSGLTQGLGDLIEQLVSSSQPPLLHLVAVCLTHAEPPIRQSAHALLGDMAISCFRILKPVMPQLMPAVLEQIVVEPSSECISVCNNAAWAVGEIALQYSSDPSPLQPFVPALIQRLVPILLNSKSPKSLSENAAVTIGRIGLVTPATVAPELGTFAQAWCTALWEIKDNEEKDSAFRGFCLMVSANPSGLDNCFIWFCNAVCKWQHPSSQLDGMFRQLLQGFKGALGNQWDPTVASFPPVIRQRLRERYDV